MALVLAYAVLAGPQLLVNMVTLFTARNHLVNDLLGNVAPVLLEFHGFEYWLQLFYAVYFRRLLSLNSSSIFPMRSSMSSGRKLLLR